MVDTVLDKLRGDVLQANLEIVDQGLVFYTFGNASGIDRDRGLVAIKPSGVPYANLQPEDIPIYDLYGKRVHGRSKPSSDLDTHLHLYRQLPTVGGIVHTHSEYATSWAQAGRAIPVLGTTHADYFCGDIPVTEPLVADEVGDDYVLNTGKAITKMLNGTDPLSVPAALVVGHGPFVWGSTVSDATHHAVVLEAVARMAYFTVTLNQSCKPISNGLPQRHYRRKNGLAATYGQ